MLCQQPFTVSAKKILQTVISGLFRKWEFYYILDILICQQIFFEFNTQMLSSTTAYGFAVHRNEDNHVVSICVNASFNAFWRV